MFGNQLLQFYNDFLSAIVMCYIIYKLNTDFKRASFLMYSISCLVIASGTFTIHFLLRDMDILVVAITNILTITLVIKFFHKLSIYYCVLTAFFGMVLFVFAELFITLVYIYPKELTFDTYNTNFVHVTIGGVLMFLFIFVLLKIIANSFIKARKRIHHKYIKFTILLAVNLITVFAISLVVYKLFGLYLDNKVASDKLYISYYSVIIIAIVLMVSIVFTLYFINYFILNTLKYNKLKKIHVMDTMTNTLNRGSGIRFIEDQLEICKKSNANLTLCYVDINDLKLVNDRLGHREGDQLIKAIVEAIKENIRDTDMICRLGGDEFVIVFPNCNIEYGEKVMMRISEQVSRLNLFKSDEFDSSISYGFSDYINNNESTVDGLLDKADHQMYLNKRAIKQLVKL